ncbi:MAG: ImmA/IrrE family metallo-endopeptidase [Clostridiales bacterium]|nr:ImmA/IrrE family metallo-endopeptidase [Clostridiales bacterium]
MKNKIQLSKKQLVDIKAKANELRTQFGVSMDVPLGKNLRMLIEKKDIVICEYPFPKTEGSHTDAAITLFETDKGMITFFGLNTSLYYDEQLFCLAHELYHYMTRTGMAYELDKEEEGSDVEYMADRFAAELLLPADAFERMVYQYLPQKDIAQVSNARLLRFIAKVQSEWMLPYQAIVRRLWEERFINEEKCDELYVLNVREKDSSYYKIFYSLDAESCELLNRKTMTHSISSSVYNTILDNFEEGVIGEDELIETLETLGKTPEDFGIENVTLDSDSDDDMDFLFHEED